MHLFKNGTFTKVNGIGFFMSLGMFGAVVFVPFVHAGYCGHQRFSFRHRHDANDAFSLSQQAL